MAEKAPEANPINWRPPLLAGFVACVIFVSIAVCQLDTALILYLFVLVPILIVVSIALLSYAIFVKVRRRRLTVLVTLGTLWAVSVFAFIFHTYHPSAVRTTAKWLVWSRSYKEKVLAQHAPRNGELKHVEWDGWGFAGQDTTVYLVFDPADSLSASAPGRQSTKFDGIPCAVDEVSRLESHWYVVRFFTNEDWDDCK